MLRESKNENTSVLLTVIFWFLIVIIELYPSYSYITVHVNYLGMGQVSAKDAIESEKNDKLSCTLCTSSLII